jgi:hypothetical protein
MEQEKKRWRSVAATSSVDLSNRNMQDKKSGAVYRLAKRCVLALSLLWLCDCQHLSPLVWSRYSRSQRRAK